MIVWRLQGHASSDPSRIRASKKGLKFSKRPLTRANVPCELTEFGGFLVLLRSRMMRFRLYLCLLWAICLIPSLWSKTPLTVGLLALLVALRMVPVHAVFGVRAPGAIGPATARRARVTVIIRDNLGNIAVKAGAEERRYIEVQILFKIAEAESNRGVSYTRSVN